MQDQEFDAVLTAKGPGGGGRHPLDDGREGVAGRAGAKAGDRVRVTMRRDDAGRTVEAPDERPSPQPPPRRIAFGWHFRGRQDMMELRL